MNKYFSILRPIAPGTIPNSRRVKNIVNFDVRKFCPEIGREAWGYIEYDGVMEDCSNYDLMAQLPRFRRKLEPGDSIASCGEVALIKEILNQEVYNNQYDISRSYCDCEIIDINDKYRSWKSDIDGGKVIYFDADNLYDSLDDAGKAEVDALVETCVEELRSAGIDVDGCLSYFRRTSREPDKYYLYAGYKGYGFIDMGYSSEGVELIEAAFRPLLRYIRELSKEVRFIAFPSKVTGGRCLIQKDFNNQIYRYSQYLEVVKLMKRSSCLASSGRESYLRKTVKLWVRCHGDITKVVKELNDRVSDSGKVWTWQYSKEDKVYGLIYSGGEVVISIGVGE